MELFRVFNLFIYDDPKLIGEKNKKRLFGESYEKKLSIIKFAIRIVLYVL